MILLHPSRLGLSPEGLLSGFLSWGVDESRWGLQQLFVRESEDMSSPSISARTLELWAAPAGQPLPRSAEPLVHGKGGDLCFLVGTRQKAGPNYLENDYYRTRNFLERSLLSLLTVTFASWPLTGVLGHGQTARFARETLGPGSLRLLNLPR